MRSWQGRQNLEDQEKFKPDLKVEWHFLNERCENFLWFFPLPLMIPKSGFVKIKDTLYPSKLKIYKYCKAMLFFGIIYYPEWFAILNLKVFTFLVCFCYG